MPSWPQRTGRDRYGHRSPGPSSRFWPPLPSPSSGVAVHIIPFQIIKQIAKLPSNEGIKATVKLLGCFASFTLVYAALGFFVGRAYGAWLGLLAALAAPLCGYVSVRLAERVQRIGGLLEGYRIVRARGTDLEVCSRPSVAGRRRRPSSARPRMSTHSIITYGSHRAQTAELWRPVGSRGDRPVVVLIHGGLLAPDLYEAADAPPGPGCRRPRLGGLQHRIPESGALRQWRMARDVSTTSPPRSTR